MPIEIWSEARSKRVSSGDVAITRTNCLRSTHMLRAQQAVRFAGLRYPVSLYAVAFYAETRCAEIIAIAPVKGNSRHDSVEPQPG